MSQRIPRVTIDGRDVDFVRAAYTQPGGLAAASLEFNLPIQEEIRKLWNKEVTFYVDKGDSKPIFRGWINRTKKTDNDVTIFAEDAIGYMIKGGDTNVAKIVFDETQNVDGLTVGAAIKKIIELAKYSMTELGLGGDINVDEEVDAAVEKVNDAIAMGKSLLKMVNSIG